MNIYVRVCVCVFSPVVCNEFRVNWLPHVSFRKWKNHILKLGVVRQAAADHIPKGLADLVSLGERTTGEQQSWIILLNWNHGKKSTISPLGFGISKFNPRVCYCCSSSSSSSSLTTLSLACLLSLRDLSGWLGWRSISTLYNIHSLPRLELTLHIYTY